MLLPIEDAALLEGWPQSPTVGEQPSQAARAEMSLTCVGYRSIDSIAAQWDRLVPRDLPHLRAGFLKACQESEMILDPVYLTVHRDGELVGTAVAYTLLVDAAQTMPPDRRRRVNRVRRWFPRYKYSSLRICGSPVSNGESGVYLDPRLTPAERREVFHRIAREVLKSASLGQVIFFKEFTDKEVAGYASELEENLGFFSGDPGPGTRLDLRWPSFEHYLAAMQKRYRARIRKDMRIAEEELEFVLLDSFAELAPTAARLYLNVVENAPFTLQVAGERFFKAVSDFEQAKLLVARHRATGEVLGLNLLLFGDTCMHNLYIGFDYARNERFHTYFSLVEHSLRVAFERKCRVCYLGQASYEFKARLGAVPYRLVSYLKHRIGPIHRKLRANRDNLYPRSEVAVHDVFRAGSDE
jgi:hypothetical protein